MLLRKRTRDQNLNIEFSTTLVNAREVLNLETKLQVIPF
jgi:hypothetical protein